MHYATGEEALVGDRGDYLGEASLVEHVLDSETSIAEWGLNQRGIMMTNRSSGRVFEPVSGETLGHGIEFRGRTAVVKPQGVGDHEIDRRSRDGRRSGFAKPRFPPASPDEGVELGSPGLLIPSWLLESVALRLGVS